MPEQIAEIEGVTPTHGILLVVIGQSSGGKGARGIEQTQPRLLSIGGNHRFRAQLPDAVRNSRFIDLLVCENSNGRLESEPAGESAEPAQDQPFRLPKKVVAPFQRGVQRLVPWRRGPPSRPDGPGGRTPAASTARAPPADPSSRPAPARPAAGGTGYHPLAREFSLIDGAARGTRGHLGPGGRDQRGFVAGSPWRSNLGRPGIQFSRLTRREIHPVFGLRADADLDAL